MRKGRIYIYIALILIFAIVAAVMYFRNRSGGAGQAEATPEVRIVDVVIAGQNISRGAQITADMLTTMQMPEDQVVEGLFTDINDVVGMYAKYPLDQGIPITTTMLSASPGTVAQGGGSPWVVLIPPGMTAVSVPITRLSSVGYGIRDGDHINVIVSMLMVDVDTNYQSVLPNATAGITIAGGRAAVLGAGSETERTGTLAVNELLTNIVSQSVSGLYVSPQGRAEFDSNLQAPFYVVPMEDQRPRQVAQMILQDILVLHIGDFPLTGDIASSQTSTQAGTPTATPQGGTTITPSTTRPDIMTVVVNPQDAVALTYLMYTGAQFTFTLRGPSDDVSRVETEAVTLQYLLSQYDIPVPAKLPYALEPRTDTLIPPSLPNDIIIIAPQE